MKVAMLLKDVPEPVKSAFKAWCARRGYSMKQVLVNFMREQAESSVEIVEIKPK